MSNYCYPYCMTCGKSSFHDMNRGDAEIQHIGHILPILVYALNQYRGNYLELRMMAYGEDMISFMLEHAEHNLWCMSEYGPDNERSGPIVQGKWEIKKIE